MDSLIDKASPIVERRPIWSFLISSFIPLFQISMVVITFNDNERLFDTVIGVFTLGLIGDFVGIVISALGMRNHGDSKCFYPLLLNLFFAIPKVLIICLYQSMD